MLRTPRNRAMPNARDNITVLVADDEPSTLALVASHVRSKGYKVLEASDGDQAWQLAHEHLPDLVVLDVMMPGMSGWEVCRKIREAVSLAHTGVVMLTGIGENLNEMTSPLYGADTYIDKPFEFTELDAKIRETLEQRQQGAMGRPDAPKHASSAPPASADAPASDDRETLVSDESPAPAKKPSAKPAKAAPKPKKTAAKKAAPAKKVAPKKAAPAKKAKKAAPKKPKARKAPAKKAKKAAPKKAKAKKAPAKKAKKAAPKKAKAKKAAAAPKPKAKTAAPKKAKATAPKPPPNGQSAEPLPTPDADAS
jgi:CheY-like chemotaxis protein